MSNHSVIEHRANYHFLKIEEDYVLICSQGEQYPQCKAAILAILEHWANDKKSKGQETRIYMTYPEWIDAMYGLFRRSTIIACLNELISEGLISRSPCRRHGKDTYEYILHVQVVQERLKQLAERIDKNTRPNLNASKFKRVQKQTGVNLNASTRPNLNASEHEHPSKFKRNIDSITEIPSNIDSENAPAFSENENVSHFGHNAWNCEAWCNAQGKTCADYQAYIDSGEREETPTEPRTPAIQIGAPDGHPTPDHPTTDHRAADSVRPDTPATQQTLEQGANHATSTTDRVHSHPPGRSVDWPATEETPVKQTTSKSRAASSAPPAMSEGHEQQDGAATEIGSGPRASGKRKGKKVTQAPPELSPEVTRILDDWDSLHKEPVPRTERLIAAAKLLEPTRPTRDELKGCRDWLPTTDRPGKPWYRSHGVKLADIAENITQYRQVLAMSIEPAPLADMKQPKPMDIYTAASLDPERTERNLEKLRQRRLAREAAAQQQGGVN